MLGSSSLSDVFLFLFLFLFKPTHIAFPKQKKALSSQVPCFQFPIQEESWKSSPQQIDRETDKTAPKEIQLDKEAIVTQTQNTSPFSYSGVQRIFTPVEATEQHIASLFSP
jgi:hypothetical protein